MPALARIDLPLVYQLLKAESELDDHAVPTSLLAPDDVVREDVVVVVVACCLDVSL